MRKIFAVLAIALFTLTASAQKREHRATWMSGYISDWPTAKLTASNADSQKRLCLAHLDSLQRNNFTTIYFHVRTMCDAFYDSKYEPWSSYISPSRGTAAAFDPLAFILENAHARGLEVYAWLNPYRYINSSSSEGWGSAGGDKNYENGHPDWLIKWKNGSQTWTILNPALPEVKQRIEDVVADIMDKYDVDGIVFDDYFYQNGLPEGYDASFYQAYVEETEAKEETPMPQLDWRRENVNDMVRRVNARIKREKPWVRFGIGPAGVAGRPEVVEKYGVGPCPGSDWQYNGIASDPLAWLSEGSIDFISPQVYWSIGNSAANYALITPWWYKVSAKFNRHCYISQTLSSFYGLASMNEYFREIDMTRTNDELDAPGFVFFPWRYLYAYSMKENGKQMKLMTYLRENIYRTPALTPAASWMVAECPGSVSGLRRDGRTISWSGPENVRFTVYAVPVSMGTDNFRKDPEFLKGVSYGKSFEIPSYESAFPEFGITDADLGKYNYAVAILDRYGNEYAPFFVGAPASSAAKPAVTYPAAGQTTPPLFDFEWDGSSQLYEFTVAADAGMTEVLYKTELAERKISSDCVSAFEEGKTYYCRVTGRSNNAQDVHSDVVPFMVDVFRITSPAAGAADCRDDLSLEWSAISGATGYELEVSAKYDFSEIVYTAQEKGNSHKVLPYNLSGKKEYFARVTATVGGKRYVTEAVPFTTKAIAGGVPQLVSPAADGVTLYSNSIAAMLPQRGNLQHTFVISSSQSFPARSSYTGVFKDFEFRTPELSEIRMISQPLADGQTYYVRANASYFDEDGVWVTSDWSEARSFVYSSAVGSISDAASCGVYVAGTDSPVLVASVAGAAAEVYTADGVSVMSVQTDASGNASLQALAPGVYLLNVRMPGGKTVSLKFIRE